MLIGPQGLPQQGVRKIEISELRPSCLGRRYDRRDGLSIKFYCEPRDIRGHAANLRRLRHEKELSQDDLAYEAEVSRSYLSQLEKGAFYASLKIIGRLDEALRVEPAELLKRGAIEKERR